MLADQNKRKSDLKRTSSNKGDYDDEELKKAIQMSLRENDLDLDSHNLFPSLANASNDDEDDLRRAIAMSLENRSTNDNQAQQSIGNDSKFSTPESAEEIRKRRLEFLNKKQ